MTATSPTAQAAYSHVFVEAVFANGQIVGCNTGLPVQAIYTFGQGVGGATAETFAAGDPVILGFYGTAVGGGPLYGGGIDMYCLGNIDDTSIVIDSFSCAASGLAAAGFASIQATVTFLVSGWTYTFIGDGACTISQYP